MHIENYVIHLMKKDALFVSKDIGRCFTKQNWVLKDIFMAYDSLWNRIYLH